MQAWRALVGSQSDVVLVCIYVCMYEGGLHIVYVPLRHVPLMMPSQRRSRTQRIPVEDYARTTPDVQRRLTAQQKDEDNGDKKRLVCQHPSDLLSSPTHERDRQRTAQRCLDSALSIAILSYRTFHMLRVRHMMHMRIPSYTCTVR